MTKRQEQLGPMAPRGASGRKRLAALAGAIVGAAVVLLLIRALGLHYYWDLNDDFMIDRILTGAYTGRPALHDIQNLYSWSALVGLLERAAGAIDWYAVLLLGLQFLSVGILVYRSGRTGIVMLTLLLGEMLYHFAFVQYSVTVGLLSAAAAAILLTVDEAKVYRPDGRLSISGILRATAGALVLVWIAYSIRSEMLLFCAPFIALAALFRGVELFCRPAAAESRERGSRKGEEKAGTRIRQRKHHGLRLLVGWILTTAFTAAAGIGVLWGIDTAAYSSPEWKTFRNFFDARTELYDFQRDWMKPYEEDREFYDSIGLDSSEVALLWNYNFGIDKDITAKTLARTADQAARHAAEEDPPAERWRAALYDYRMTFRSQDLRPYNLISAVLYGLVFFLTIVNAAVDRAAGMVRKMSRMAGTEDRTRTAPAADAAGTAASEHGQLTGPEQRKFTGEVPSEAEMLYQAQAGHTGPGRVWVIMAVLTIFLTRSGLYLYLLYHHRPVERLTHCLYLLEAVLLLWLLTGQIRRAASLAGSLFQAVGRLFSGALWLLLVLVFCTAAVLQGQKAVQAYAQREETNRSWQAYLTYVQQHGENFYFTDVYSSVDFSEKMLDNSKVMASNWDFAGGWVCWSPLWKEKLDRYGISSMEEGLLDSDRVYFAARNDSDLDWLSDYYRFRGKRVHTEAADTIDSYWTVYRIVEE